MLLKLVGGQAPTACAFLSKKVFIVCTRMKNLAKTVTSLLVCGCVGMCICIREGIGLEASEQGGYTV